MCERRRSSDPSITRAGRTAQREVQILPALSEPSPGTEIVRPASALSQGTDAALTARYRVDLLSLTSQISEQFRSIILDVAAPRWLCVLTLRGTTL
jgi:hypothetical protein